MRGASTICLTVLSAAASIVCARPSASYITRALPGAPYRRQSNSTASNCTSICDPVNKEVNGVSCIPGLAHVDVLTLVQGLGCPVTECCTQSFETGYYNCLMCVGTALNETDYSQAQIALDRKLSITWRTSEQTD